MAHNTTDIYTLTGKKIGNIITNILTGQKIASSHIATTDIYTLTGKKIGSLPVAKTDIYILTGKKIGSTIKSKL